MGWVSMWATQIGHGAVPPRAATRSTPPNAGGRGGRFTHDTTTRAGTGCHRGVPRDAATGAARRMSDCRRWGTGWTRPEVGMGRMPSPCRGAWPDGGRDPTSFAGAQDWLGRARQTGPGAPDAQDLLVWG